MSAEAVAALSDELRSRTQPLESDTYNNALLTIREGLSSSNLHTATATIEALLSFWPLLNTNASVSKAISLLIAHTASSKTCLIDKLGDSNKRTRDLAGRALLLAAQTSLLFSSSEDSPFKLLETIIKDQGFVHKQARTREACLLYLKDIRKTEPALPLKQWLPSLLATLEDSDSSVRETARDVTVAIFADNAVSEAARSDLKKELQKQSIRGADDLIAKLSTASAAGGQDNVGLGVPEEGRHGMGSRTASIASVASSVGATPLDSVAPIYVSSVRDLEAEFQAMVEPFSGKETEHNWQARDKYINRIRGMLKSDAQVTYREAFLAGLKLVIDDVLRIMMTLRTTLAIATCNLIGELAEHLKTSLDPFYEPILNHLLKIAAQTKKLVVQASEVAMGALIANCSYSYKGLNLLWEGMQAKPVATRQASAVHTKTMLITHGTNAKSAMEASGGLALFEKILQKGITDPTPGVREASRSAYWIFNSIWPHQAQLLMDALDPAAKSQLQKSVNGLNSSTSKPDATKRPSVRSMISAAKRTNSGIASSSSPSKSQSNPLPSISGSPSASSNVRTPRSRTSTIGATNASPSPKATIHTRTSTSSTSSTVEVSNNNRQRAQSSGSSRSTGSKKSPKSPPMHLHQSRSTLKSPRIPFASTSSTQDPTTPTARRTKPPIQPQQEDLYAASLPSEQSDSDAMDASFDGGGMVEAAMRDQANQAEQAAARLMELVADEEPALSTSFNPKTPIKSLEQRIESLNLQNGSFDDSPATNGNSTEQSSMPIDLAIDSWWLASTDFDPKPIPLPVETQDDLTSLHGLYTHLSEGKLDVSKIHQLCQLVRDRPAITDAEFWTKEGSIGKLVDAVCENLRSADTPLPQAEATLVLLKDLVVYSTPVLGGQEMTIISLLLRVAVDRPSRNSAAAMRTILALYLAQIEDLLYSLMCLRMSMTSLFNTQVASSSSSVAFSAALKALGYLFLRLPAEVLEEEVPQTRDLLLKGINSTEIEVRHATVSSLCAAQRVLRDDTRVFGMLDGLTKPQTALLTYFFAKENVNNSVQSI